MTRHIARAYAAATAVLVLFLAWAVIAADPWSSSRAAADPRVAALQARELKVRHEAVVVRRVVRHRWAVYRVRLAHRRQEIARGGEGPRSGRCRRPQAAAARAELRAPRRSRWCSLPPITVTRTLVMLRRELRAMGTTVEILLDAAPGEARERALDTRCDRDRGAGAPALALRPGLGADRAQPAGPPRRRRRPAGRRRRSPSRRARRPAGASTRPCTTPWWRPATTAPSTRSPPTGPSRPAGPRAAAAG